MIRRFNSDPIEDRTSAPFPSAPESWVPANKETAAAAVSHQDSPDLSRSSGHTADIKTLASSFVGSELTQEASGSNSRSGSWWSSTLFCCCGGQQQGEGETSEHNGWGRGIVADVRRTIGTHWIGEMINLDLKIVAVSFFLFFACIAPAITFGAIYAKATHNWIGAVEMILATAWCGIVYALIGGQPMMINGGTGPVLAFSEILYKLSENLDVPFLTFNAWIGLWVTFYMLVAAFTDLNRIIKYATRFTDEIFALLISTIFIINALGNPFAPVGIFYYFDPNHPSHEPYENDPTYSYMAVALLSLFLCIGTVQVAFLLRKAKFSPFLFTQLARNVITDFSVVLAIAIMTVIGIVGFSSVPLETLNVPNTFAPTYACCDETCTANWPEDCPGQSQPYGQRPWFVDLSDLNGKTWVVFMAAGPAVLAFILVFLDNGITWHLINHPTHKLTHGEAFNYDTVVTGVMIAVNSLLGLPWLVAATVRSLNHVHAMAEKTPAGKIESVKETRLTNLFIHLLCLASIFALDVLKLLPMAVLYGVFLFMGLVSLSTNQFWSRILMFFMQPSKYPIEPYTVHMKPNRMLLFTALQLLLFIILYAVKAIKVIAIAFPLVIACCIPIRVYVLPKIFTEQELVMIDSDDEAIEAYLARQEQLEEGDTEDSMAKHKSVEPDEENQITVPATEKINCEDTDEQFGEERDQVPPLVNTADKPRRRRRLKTVSCPPHMLFAEVPLTASNVTVSTVVVEEQHHDDHDGYADATIHSESTENNVAPEIAQPRRRRTKAVSCPPHMLFNEAERHVASNYFFG